MPDPDRIATRLQALWELSIGPGGGAARPAYSPAEAAAMRLVARWSQELGLAPAIDAHGNLWALPGGWAGPLVTAGSHVDTVPDGGRFDGALGTVVGLELAADLSPAGGAARPGVLVCAAEEAPRFGAGTIGSRLLTGTLSPPALAKLTDEAGISAAAALEDYLRTLDDLPRIDPPTDRLRAHAEIHVSPRPDLRRLGVVAQVAAPRRLTLRVTGEAGHSGEVAMAARRDALPAAAEMILAVETAATAEPPQTVATAGTIAVAPGALSVIPAEARLGIDMRGIDRDSLARLEAAIRKAVAEIAQRRGVGAALELTRSGEPVTMDEGLVAAALAAADRLGVPAERTWSGSGHDAQHLSGLLPTLLLFVPLHGGPAHTPREGADMAEIVQAARVAAAVLGERAAGGA